MSKPSSKIRRPTRGRAQLRRLRNATDVEIARTAPDELHELPDDFWEGAKLVAPVPKEAISLRLDQDVLAWFRAQGPRYQSRINAILRSYMTHVRHRPKGRGRA